MGIFIDGDSCNRRIREIVLGRCRKEGIPLKICSNRSLPESKDSPDFFWVVQGKTVDDYILINTNSEDWVLTRDLPLAKMLLEKGVGVFNDRGREFSLEEIDNRLRERELMLALRQNGGGPPKLKSFGPKDIQVFSQWFDRLMVRIRP